MLYRQVWRSAISAAGGLCNFNMAFAIFATQTLHLYIRHKTIHTWRFRKGYMATYWFYSPPHLRSFLFLDTPSRQYATGSVPCFCGFYATEYLSPSDARSSARGGYHNRLTVEVSRRVFRITHGYCQWRSTGLFRLQTHAIPIVLLTLWCLFIPKTSFLLRYDSCSETFRCVTCISRDFVTPDNLTSMSALTVRNEESFYCINLWALFMLSVLRMSVVQFYKSQTWFKSLDYSSYLEPTDGIQQVTNQLTWEAHV